MPLVEGSRRGKERKIGEGITKRKALKSLSGRRDH
jgi:hypothetical protein